MVVIYTQECTVQLTENYLWYVDRSGAPGKADAMGAFLSEWSTEYVPAIVSYGEKSRKASIIELILSMNSSGECISH